MTATLDGERRGSVYSAHCKCRELLDVISNKWSTMAIGAMGDGPQRFGDLLRRLEGISPKVLTQTLRRLEDRGLVTRTVYPSVPSHVEYALTPLGQDAGVPLAALRDWAERKAYYATASVATDDGGRRVADA